MKYRTLFLAVLLATGGTAASLRAQSPGRSGAVDRELGRGSGATIRACSLLSQTDVEKITGRRLEEGVQDMGAVCEYGMGTVTVRTFAGKNPEADVEWVLKNYGKQSEAKLPVSGFPPGSFLMYPKPRDQYEGTYAVIVVKAGLRMLMLSLEAEGGKPAESVQPQLVALAKAAVAKLP